MTEHRNDKQDARLEALYREAGDVEPDAGLDRIIRARADEAAGSHRSSSRLPWLGGLVTASVAIVAIAVVLQQSPPSQPAQDSFAPLEESEPEAYMSPSLGADAEMKSSSEMRRARSEIRDMQSAGADAPEAAPPPSPAALPTPAQSLSEEQRAARRGDIVAEQAVNVAEPAEAVARGITEDPDAMLTRIEELLEQDEIQPARELLETFRQKYPEHAIPEKIEKALTPPE